MPEVCCNDCKDEKTPPYKEPCISCAKYRTNENHRPLFSPQKEKCSKCESFYKAAGQGKKCHSCNEESNFVPLVKTCKDCKFWTQNQVWNLSFGTCSNKELGKEIDIYAPKTRPTFGCILWESR